MFQLVTFIILLNEIFLYSSAPLTSMAAPQPLAGGKDEMNSSLIRNNNNKNTHKTPSAFYFSFPFRGGGVTSGLSISLLYPAPLAYASGRDGGGPETVLVQSWSFHWGWVVHNLLRPGLSTPPDFAAAFCWQSGSWLCCRHKLSAFTELPTRRGSWAFVFLLYFCLWFDWSAPQSSIFKASPTGISQLSSAH